MDKAGKEGCKTIREVATPRFSLTLKVTPDNLKAFVDVTPGEELAVQLLTKEELIALLAESLSAGYLEEDSIERIVDEVNNKKIVEMRRVSKGKPALPGRNGKILFLVKKLEKKSPLQFVDLRYIRQFDNIEKGTIVARIYPPSHGMPGSDVFSARIDPAAGSVYEPELDSESLQAGFTEAYTTIVAQRAGYLEVEGNKLTLKDELSIRGDIDFKSGDIDFIGRVKIKGSVLNGFKVTARGDIEIGGDIECGKAYSTTGSITVKGNIVGAGTEDTAISSELLAAPAAKLSRLKERFEQVGARVAVSASIIEGAIVTAGSAVNVQKEILSSHVRTHGIINASKARIIGGEVEAVVGIEGGVIGTPAGTPTTVRLVSEVESTQAYRDLIVQLKAHGQAEALIGLYLGPYADNPASIELLPAEKRRRMLALFDKLSKIKESKEKLVTERDELLQGAKPNYKARLNFYQNVCPGVSIFIAGQAYPIKEQLLGPGSLSYKEGAAQFTVAELEPFNHD